MKQLIMLLVTAALTSGCAHQLSNRQVASTGVMVGVIVLGMIASSNGNLAGSR